MTENQNILLLQALSDYSDMSLSHNIHSDFSISLVVDIHFQPPPTTDIHFLRVAMDCVECPRWPPSSLDIPYRDHA